MNIDLQELKRKAEEATQGPLSVYVNKNDDVVIRKMFDDGQEAYVVARVKSGFADANFIADANPQIVLALISEIERLRAMIEDYRHDYRC